MDNDYVVTRRRFLASTSCLGAALAVARYFPASAIAAEIAGDLRFAEKPLVDKGFASVRRIGEGVYATISDPSKGIDTLCNGGFIIGRESVLLVEGYRSPAGASFQMDALREVSKLPVQAAVDTHYHFDHSMGNTHYGGQGIAVWAHAKAGPLMVQNYGMLQGKDKTDQIASYEKRVRDAANETERQRAQGDLNLFKMIVQTIDSSVVALPNHPLDPEKLPVSIDLGGTVAVIETYPGHTPTDLIIRVPDRNIVFTGDLLFSSMYPVTFDGDIGGWRRTLGKFAGFGSSTVFVPGHGRLCGQEGIALLRDIFDDLAAHAVKMFQAGVPAEEATRRYTVPDRFKEYPIFAWSFCIGPTMTKLYEEYKAGAPKS
jgi:glyoxylase-like metal-dependent hydrolase (beta-lactamase superfamily II)